MGGTTISRLRTRKADAASASSTIRNAGHRDLHAQRDEEEGHEEVADAGRLGDHVKAVGEGRKADPGDQRAHLAREPDQAGDGRQEEAPGEGADEHQLGRLGDSAEEVREQVLGDDQAGQHERRAFQQAQRERKQGRALEVGLDGQHGHRPEVLDDEDAERDPARQGVELELVVEQLDHDQGAAEAHRRRQVEERVVALMAAEAEGVEEAEAERDADRHLQGAGQQDRRAGRGQLLEVDLEPDDEEQEDQADLGHRRDAGLVGDEVEDVRPDDDPGQEVGEDQRLAEAPADEGEQGSRRDADADCREKVAGRS